MSEYEAGQTLKIRTDYDGAEDITAGKVYYATVEDVGRVLGVWIKDDEECDLYCIIGHGCLHIDDNEWEVVE